MSLVLLRVVDSETSGLKVPQAEICELGWTDVLFDPEKKICHFSQPSALLYRPERGIPPEASAIHHLTDEDLIGFAGCSEADLRALVNASSTWDGYERPAFIVSHNWAMEGQFFTPHVLGDARPICTMKSARRVWPEAPGYSNQTLRYWRKLPVDKALADPPHRAGPDTHVTAHLLAALLAEARVSHMVHWTTEPAYFAVCPIGKNKGQPWPDQPASFLEWMTSGKVKDMDPDLVAAARAEMHRRFAP